MPLAQLTLTRGALSEDGLAHLARDLTDILVDHQGARPESLVARSITCLEVNEIEPRRFFVGGHATVDRRYRLSFTIPAGAMDENRKVSLVDHATRAIMRAEGSAFDEFNTCRVWCIVNEVPDGNWASGGKIFRWRDIVRWVARQEIIARRSSKIRASKSGVAVSDALTSQTAQPA